MTTLAKRIIISVAIVSLSAVIVHFYPVSEKVRWKQPHKQTLLSASDLTDSLPIDKAEAEKAMEIQVPAPTRTQVVDGNIDVAGDADAYGDVSREKPEAAEAIDPVRLAQAELELVTNQIYEEVARDTLPTLSIQTHNPVWKLEYEAAQKRTFYHAAGGTVASDNSYGSGEIETLPDDSAGDNSDEQQVQSPLPAPESGEFGNIQPPEGEIWLRIPADYASEYRDIMAQNADLYRTETGYSDTVTVMLWVGGRPYDRQEYE